jgi:hypothetical protein
MSRRPANSQACGRPRGEVAGGYLVGDANAPEWWILADAEGNEVDLAIWG